LGIQLVPVESEGSLRTFCCKMNSLFVIIAIVCLISLTRANPVAVPDPVGSPFEIGGNDLFQQINDIIKRGIDSQIKTNDSVEVGDKIKSDDGSLKISINEFSENNRFPVRFRVHHPDVDDITIVPIVGDFDGSSEYKLKKTSSSSEESSEENSKDSNSKKTSITSSVNTATSAAPQASTTAKDSHSSQTLTSANVSASSLPSTTAKSVENSSTTLKSTESSTAASASSITSSLTTAATKN